MRLRIFVLLMISILTAIDYYMLNGIFENKFLASKGAHIHATVVDRFRGERRNGVIHYRFTLKGTSYSNTVILSESSYRRIALGDQVEIIYLPAHPNTNALASSVSNNPPSAGLILLVMLNIGVVGGFIAFLREGNQKTSG